MRRPGFSLKGWAQWMTIRDCVASCTNFLIPKHSVPYDALRPVRTRGALVVFELGTSPRIRAHAA